MYDHFVSLGYNCEAAFNFRRLLGKDRSSYFHWLVTPYESLLKIVENDFKGDFCKENLYHRGGRIGMVTDGAYNISHHSPFKEIQGRLSGDEFEIAYEKHKGKLEHLKAKFYDQVNSTDSILYFIKLKSGEGCARSQAVRLRDTFFSKFSNGNMYFCVLQERDQVELDWGEPHIFNRYLDRFSPYNNVPDTHVESWDKLFREFKHSSLL